MRRWQARQLAGITQRILCHKKHIERNDVALTLAARVLRYPQSSVALNCALMRSNSNAPASGTDNQAATPASEQLLVTFMAWLREGKHLETICETVQIRWAEIRSNSAGNTVMSMCMRAGTAIRSCSSQVYIPCRGARSLPQYSMGHEPSCSNCDRISIYLELCWRQ